jgi:hypothetical protein
MRVIAGRFSFLADLGRIFGITASHSHSAILFSAKYLKKWYHLPTRPVFPARIATPVACLQGELVDATVMKVLLRRAIGRARNCAWQNRLPFPTDSCKASQMHNERAISRTAARNFANDRQGYRGVNAAAALACRCPEQTR